MVTQEFTPEEIALEEWRGIPGYESLYQASSLGRVRSFHTYNRKTPGYILKPILRKDGYLSIRLFQGRKGKTMLYHAIVAKTFIGPRPDGLVINHIDGDRTNNRPENLEYVTAGENLRHARDVLHTMPKRGHDWAKRCYPRRYGEQSSNPKLTEADVRAIRALYAPGRIRQRDIAEMYGVGQTTICAILCRKTWKHLPPAP